MALIIGKRYIFNLDFKSAKKRLKTVAHGKSMTTLVFVVFFFFKCFWEGYLLVVFVATIKEFMPS